MKIQIPSVLHLDLIPKLEGADLTIIEHIDADVRVLAGDIHGECQGIDWFQN